MKRSINSAAIAILIALCAVRGVFADDRLQIYTVNYPLAYFAERISGDLAEVTFPAPPGVDPAFWMPEAETIAAYQGADLILLNGADYAKWASKVSLPGSRLVDTSRGFRDELIHVGDGISHSHGPGGDHAHGGVAFTTWLDLDQAAQQADAIARALIRKRPEAKEGIERDLKSLQDDLLALDRRIKEVAGVEPGRPLLASHPVYQYLARRYDLNLQSLMWEPEEVPNQNQLTELKVLLSDHPARWMLWEAEPAGETVLRLEGLGVRSLVLDPCANQPETGGFLAVMSKNAETLERIFRPESGDQ